MTLGFPLLFRVRNLGISLPMWFPWGLLVAFFQVMAPLAKFSVQSSSDFPGHAHGHPRAARAQQLVAPRLANAKKRRDG